ncbi:hypothetical protein SDJN02_19982, partial [Cucurbita argyrosperma subsp. argyrosperma]
MVLESILSSPHRRHPPFRKQFPANELGSWSALFNRHRFLLTALALLTLLCTIYLYFAITLGAAVSSCSGLTGAQKELCRLEHAEASLGGNGKDFRLGSRPQAQIPNLRSNHNLGRNHVGPTGACPNLVRLEFRSSDAAQPVRQSHPNPSASCSNAA